MTLFRDLTTWNSGTQLMRPWPDPLWCAGSQHPRGLAKPWLWDFTWLETATKSQEWKTRLGDKQMVQLQRIYKVHVFGTWNSDWIIQKLQKGRLVSFFDVLFSKLVQPIILGLAWKVSVNNGNINGIPWLLWLLLWPSFGPWARFASSAVRALKHLKTSSCGAVELWLEDVGIADLVGGPGPPLWKIWVRQLGWWDSQD